MITIDNNKSIFKYNALQNLRNQIFCMYSSFHNIKWWWFSSFCLQLLHFFSQSMKLLAYCFILMHTFKLTKMKVVNRCFLSLHASKADILLHIQWAYDKQTILTINIITQNSQLNLPGMGKNHQKTIQESQVFHKESCILGSDFRRLFCMSLTFQCPNPQGLPIGLSYSMSSPSSVDHPSPEP